MNTTNSIQTLSSNCHKWLKKVFNHNFSPLLKSCFPTMSLILLGEEFPQFVCLEHPESCILSKLSWSLFLFTSNNGIARILLKCSVLCSCLFALLCVFQEKWFSDWSSKHMNMQIMVRHWSCSLNYCEDQGKNWWLWNEVLSIVEKGM